MKNKRIARVGVERGFGPRHAFNAQEGSEAVPSELPSPPSDGQENYAGKALKWVAQQVRDGVLPDEALEAIKRDPTSLPAVMAYANAAMSGAALLSGGEGERLALPPGEAPKPSGAPYGNVPDTLMGYGKEERSAFKGNMGYAESRYKYTQPVKVIQPDGDFHYDEMKGLNKAHALERARRNWDGATIEAIGEGRRLQPGDEGYQHARGTKKVGVAKGHGPRHAENAREGDLTAVNTDTVPAMLTPREAVLNRNAAELAGRPQIEQLNAEGNELAKKGVDLAAGGQASVPSVKLPVPHVSGSGNVMKYVLPGTVRREAALGIPKGLEGGTDEVPPGAWGGEQPSLGQRLYHDFGDPAAMTDKATKDLMHFLAQFGAPTEPKASGLGPRISNEEMMRRYPGLQLQEGEDDTPYPERLPFEGADAAREDEQAHRDAMQLDLDMRMKARGVPPLRGLLEKDYVDPEGKPIHGGNVKGYKMMAQKGDTNVKMKSKPIRKNATAYSTSGGVPPQVPPESGSPYAQGFAKMQGFRRGGNVRGGGGFNPGADTGGYYGRPAEVAQPAAYNPGGTGEVPMPAPLAGGAPQSGGGLSPYGAPGAGVSYDPAQSGAAPYGGGASMKSYGGGFYPKGVGMFADGTGSVPGEIGTPNPQTAYDPRAQVDFKAPDISGFLQAIHKEAQKQGISQSQLGDIVKQFSGGMGGGGALAQNYAAAGSPSPVYGASGYPSAIPVGGYQGGISDIGYPPFLMPNAVYHADKGSTWEGPYDPNYLVQRYARGSGDVGRFNPNFEITGGDNTSFTPGSGGRPLQNPNNFPPDLPPEGRSPTPQLDQFDAQQANYYRNLNSGFGGFGNTPPAGTPGFLQGSTLHNNFFDAAGYPYAQPVTGDANLIGGHGHGTPPRRNE